MRFPGSLVVLAAGLLGTGAQATPGDLDPSFGAGGLVAIHRGTGNHIASDVLEQPDGRLVATGYIDSTFAIVRLNTDGDLDRTFADAGILMIPEFGSDAQGNAIVLAPNGTLIAAGNTALFREGAHYAVLARCDASGRLDPTFGEGGLVQLPQSDLYSLAAVALQPDGKIVGVGRRRTGNAFDGYVLRLDADGSLDPTFGTGGIADFDVGSFDEPVDLSLDTSGRIVVGGSGGEIGKEDMVVARFDATGALDPTFGAGGIVIRDLGFGFDTASSVRLQADGRIVVGGGPDASVMRFDDRGALDPSFGTGGVVKITDCEYPHVVVQADGKLVALGSSFVPRNVLVMARLDDRGNPDPTFGSAGGAILDVGVGSPIATALVRQADGRYVASAQTQAARVGTYCSVLRIRDASRCGDGVVDPGEACDTGPDFPVARGCAPDCRFLATTTTRTTTSTTRTTTSATGTTTTTLA